MGRSPILLLVLIAAPALAQPDWRAAPEVVVALENYDFAPREIHLKAGQPVRLHLVNRARGGHDFTARDFFAAATVRDADRGKIADGTVYLAGGATQDIALIPKAGRYKLHCGHTMHALFGMKGAIVVD